MKKLIEFITTKVMRNDLMKHFFVGTLFALTLNLFNVEPFLIMFLAFVLGALKEVHDGIKKGQMSYLDVLYTLLPSILIYLTTIL